MPQEDGTGYASYNSRGRLSGSLKNVNRFFQLNLIPFVKLQIEFK